MTEQTEVAYWQHQTSGEVWAVEYRENLVVVGSCGPLENRDATAANLADRSFDLDTDPEQIEWMMNQPFRQLAESEVYPGDR